MNESKKTVLISSLYTEGHGGVYTLLGLAVKLFKQKGYEVKVAYYMPYSIKKELSVPLKKLFRFKPRMTQYQSDLKVEEYAIGTVLPELEFTHYYPNAHWKQLIQSADYHFVVSGNVLAALPFYLSKKKYLAWIATPYLEDRRDRIKLFPWYRAILDRVVISKIGFRLEKKLLTSGTILAVSQYLKKAFGNRIGSIDNVLPMSINTQQFFPDSNKVQPWLISFTGRFTDPRKNILFLLEAFSFVVKFNNQAKLLLIGDELNDELTERIKEFGISSNIETLAYIALETLTSRLQQTDVFVIPSHQEGLCISGLEAMACGCPVVSTKCGGPEDYVNSGVNGYLTEFDTKQFANSIINICSDRLLRSKLSHEAVHTIEENYSFDRVKAVFDRYIDREFV